MIKEEELLSSKREIESFKFLDCIQKSELIKKFPEIMKTKYLLSTFSLSKKILNKIKKGEFKYNKLYTIWKDNEKKNIFKSRITILFFNNKDNIEI